MNDMELVELYITEKDERQFFECLMPHEKTVYKCLVRDSLSFSIFKFKYTIKSFLKGVMFHE